MEDRILIKGLIKRDEKAFEKFYNKYKNLVFYVINDILDNKENSEEVLQDTFVDTYNKIAKFDGNNFKAWLLKIAKNKALDYYRQTKKVIYDEEVVLSHQSIDSDNMLIDDLRKHLNKDEFIVLILITLYELKQKDVAAYLDKPIGTISWLYSEAKKKAKIFLERNDY